MFRMIRSPIWPATMWRSVLASKAAWRIQRANWDGGDDVFLLTVMFLSVFQVSPLKLHGVWLAQKVPKTRRFWVSDLVGLTFVTSLPLSKVVHGSRPPGCWRCCGAEGADGTVVSVWPWLVWDGFWSGFLDVFEAGLGSCFLDVCLILSLTLIRCFLKTTLKRKEKPWIGWKPLQRGGMTWTNSTRGSWWKLWAVPRRQEGWRVWRWDQVVPKSLCIPKGKEVVAKQQVDASPCWACFPVEGKISSKWP